MVRSRRRGPRRPRPIAVRRGERSRPTRLSRARRRDRPARVKYGAGRRLQVYVVGPGRDDVGPLQRLPQLGQIGQPIARSRGRNANRRGRNARSRRPNARRRGRNAKSRRPNARRGRDRRIKAGRSVTERRRLGRQRPAPEGGPPPRTAGNRAGSRRQGWTRATEDRPEPLGYGVVGWLPLSHATHAREFPAPATPPLWTEVHCG